MQLIPWERPRGAVHDLAHWSGIDEGARSVLLLSDRTLYILQNLAALDIGLRARWMADSNVYGYYPPEPGSEDDETFLAAVALAQEELLSVSPLSQQLYEPGQTESLQQNTGGGTATLVMPAAGWEEPVRLEAIYAVNTTAARGPIQVYLTRSGYPSILLANQTSDGPSVAHWAGGVIVPAGAKLTAYFFSTVSGDSLELRAWYTGLHWND